MPNGVKRPTLGSDDRMPATTRATIPTPAAGIEDRTNVLPRKVTAAISSSPSRMTRQPAPSPGAERGANSNAVYK